MQPAMTLEMRSISKRFGETIALDHVDFRAESSQVHAILGENGAGKSTLMQILSGLSQPDSGELLLNGQKVGINSPRSARNLGIAMVHQHFTLVPALTVAENLALDRPVPRPLWQFWKPYNPIAEAEPTIRSAAELGWKLNPSQLIADLSVGTQQRIEIAKALATDARLLILDEPTAVLTPSEVDELFGVLRMLRSQGKLILLITHKLAEILAVADQVTVLKRGKIAGSIPVRETNPKQLAEWMTGPDSIPSDCNSLLNRNSPRTPSSDNPIFSAREMVALGDRGEETLCGLSLDVRRGEIVGIGGVDGNGQIELAEALAGLRPLRSGSICWEGSTFAPPNHPKTGYIPQDRRRSGLAVNMSIADNLLMDAVKEPEFQSGPFLKKGELSRLAESLVQQFDIRAASLDMPVASLSGGNQQKIIAARVFHSKPDWIVAMNPTRGLDIGATRFVFDQLLKARTRGAAIALISTDRDEIAALADRSFILSNGMLSEYSAEDRDSAQLGLLLGGIVGSGT